MKKLYDNIDEKMRKSTLFILVLSLSSALYAQKGVEDGSRYGHGEDSIACLRNISIYTEYVKTENYLEAYTNGWKEVFRDAPLAQSSTYTNGVKILRWLYQNEQDATKKAAYSEELMQVYEQRLKYLDELNKLVKNPTPRAEVMGLYAHDYISYNPKPQLQKAYTMLREAVSAGKGETTYYVLGDLMRISSQRYKSNKDTREDLMQDYLDCATYIVEVIDGLTNEKMIEAAQKTKDNIDAYFVNSGAADCESLQAIFGPKVEENSSDITYLNKVVTLMSMLDCTASDAYFRAAEYAHALEPSSKTASSLGKMYIQIKNDYETALKFYEQAIELESDAAKLSDYYYTSAVILYQMEQQSKARTSLRSAISNNPNNGNAYILMAQLYAANYKWHSDDAMSRCAFFAVIDKLEQARRVDESVASKANELISLYRKSCPTTEDLFMYGLKKGDSIEIKGWINETTTIR